MADKRTRTLNARSGFCGTGYHDRCTVVTTNGAAAAQRYVRCGCDCHDGSDCAVERIMVVTAGLDIPGMLDASAAEQDRYLHVVNALLNPSGAAKTAAVIADDGDDD